MKIKDRGYLVFSFHLNGRHSLNQAIFCYAKTCIQFPWPFHWRFNLYDIASYCRSIFCSENWADKAALTLMKVHQEFELDPQQALIKRIRPTSGTRLKKFKEAGMSPTEHTLSVSERSQLKKVFAALPPLQKTVLRHHLRSINFLDNMPNIALTSTLNFGSEFPFFDITIRVTLLRRHQNG